MEQAEFTPFLYAELAPIFTNIAKVESREFELVQRFFAETNPMFYKYTKINVKLYSFSS